MKTAEPIRDKQHVAALLSYYANRGDTRNHLLITLGIFTALRISDILSLSWNDVYNFNTKKLRKSIHLTEQKTGKSKIIAVHKELRTALVTHMSSMRPARPNPDTVLILNSRTNKAISRVQAHRIVRSAGEGINLPYTISCHSLRKTFGYHTWKEGISPAVIMDIYNHSNLHVTRRYLGITQDDKNAAYLALSFERSISACSQDISS